MRERVFDDAEGIPPDIDPAISVGTHDAMLRAAWWQDLGNDDPRLPQAFMIAFSAAAFSSSSFERHGAPLPAALAKAVPKRQAEFVAGRLAARRAIERLGVAAAMPGIGPSREPQWQAGVTGSITHAGEIAGAVAVVSSSVTGVGIDIENVVEADAREAIRELAITPGEHALLEARRRHLSAGMIVTIAFSAKESFFKGVFSSVGRYFGFDAVRISWLDADAGRLGLTLRKTLCPSLPEGRSFALGFKLLSANTVATSFVW